MAKIRGYAVRKIGSSWGFATGILGHGATTCSAWVWRDGRLVHDATVPIDRFGGPINPPKDELAMAKSQASSW